MLLALTYYIVPRVTNTPLYSYTLSLISFWGMAFFYTGVGDHHILQSPTPSWLKTIAEVSSWMLLVPVFAFTINILGTMKGNWDRFFTNLPLRFTMTAFFFYFLVNIQGAFEAIQPFNKLTHFTNFVVAHAHLALLGAFTILGMGVIDYMVAQIFGKPLWSRSLSEWMYWLVTVGFTGFFSVLTLAGFQQGFSWQDGIPEVNVLNQLHAYYIARGIFGAMIVVSGIVQIVNIGMTIFTDTAERRRRETLPGRRGGRSAGGRMSATASQRSGDGAPKLPRGWVRHPRERMLITPLVAGLGGLVAFFVVVCDRRLAADPHVRSAAVGRLGAAVERGRQGSQPLRGERLLRLPLRLHAAAGRAPGPLLPLPEGLAAGRLLGAATSRRTCSGPSGPGPTSPRSPAGIRTTGSGRTSTTRASSTRCR